MDKLTVPEAAARLGMSENALRKRIQRGTIEHDKDEDGRVFVYLSPETSPTMTDQADDQATGQATNQVDDRAGDQPRLIERLENEVEYLRREVEDWKDESRRKDAIIMTMAQRIPELEAPTEEASPEPRESPETGSDLSPGVDPQGEDAGRETGESRPWWKRWFGG